ncbi:MAG: hypothetical protein H0U75_03545 [Legionella sp.]|nr:hypothetical protein [Legionella sp.]
MSHLITRSKSNWLSSLAILVCLTLNPFAFEKSIAASAPDTSMSDKVAKNVDKKANKEKKAIVKQSKKADKNVFKKVVKLDNKSLQAKSKRTPSKSTPASSVSNANYKGCCSGKHGGIDTKSLQSLRLGDKLLCKDGQASPTCTKNEFNIN